MNDKKCAFALYAKGRLHEAFKENVIRGINRHVPGVDVIELDANKAMSLLGVLPDNDRPYFVRMAIPLMEEMRMYDRVIWVDVDVDIVSDKFSGILDVETSDDGLAAALDFDFQSRIKYMKGLYPEFNKASYVNSGVMVFDMHKIDADKWRDRVLSGLKEWMSKKHIWHDQDVFNAEFDISVIDGRFNYIWRSGEWWYDGAWLVHYCDGRGHGMLERLLRVKDRGTRENGWKDRCVVTSLRHEFIKPWIRSYFASGNTLPLVIIPNPPNRRKKGDVEYCMAAAEMTGGLVFFCDSEWEESSKLSDRAAYTPHDNIGWYSKKLLLHSVAKNLSPKSWVWVDDDAELTGNLNECFDEAEKAPGFIFAQFYYGDSSNRQHPKRFKTWKNSGGDKLCWGSLVFYHGDANRFMERDLARHFPIEDDEIVFSHLYHTDKDWHEGFCDFSDKNWQATCMRLRDIPRKWGGKLLHYCSHENHGEAKRYWALKADKIRLAPFETGVRSGGDKCGEDTPVDAVFVIGNGSHHNNEELRYALRNLDTHCKFIRDVYICGECPDWIDKSKVIHLPWKDRFFHAKDANIIDKLLHACLTDGISKRILFCSDDQFQTRECSWDDFRPRYLRRYEQNDRWYADMHRLWHTRLRKTLDREAKRRKSVGMDERKVFYYQPHMWMQIDRDAFIRYAKWCEYEKRDDTIIASGYFNFSNAAGVQDFDHIFISNGLNGKVPNITHIAYNDGSFSTAMEMLKKMFPARCRFEKVDSRSSCNTHAQTERRDLHADRRTVSVAERNRMSDIISRVREDDNLSPLLGDISLAEEMRIVSAPGWRTVWSDIISRFESATEHADGIPGMSVDACRIIRSFRTGQNDAKIHDLRSSGPRGRIMSALRKKV